MEIIIITIITILLAHVGLTVAILAQDMLIVLLRPWPNSATIGPDWMPELPE